MPKLMRALVRRFNTRPCQRARNDRSDCILPLSPIGATLRKNTERLVLCGRPFRR